MVPYVLPARRQKVSAHEEKASASEPGVLSLQLALAPQTITKRHKMKTKKIAAEEKAQSSGATAVGLKNP